jgi:hypothetical protein
LPKFPAVLAKAHSCLLCTVTQKYGGKKYRFLGHLQAAMFIHSRSALASGEIASGDFQSLPFGFSQRRNCRPQF